MRKMRLTNEERAMEAMADQYVPVDAKTFKEMAEALEARRKDAVISIRLNSRDLNCIKRKAEKLGIKYQTFITEVLRKVAQS